MIKSQFDSKLVTLRDLTEQDIPLVLNYWFHSPAGFVESIGADANKMGTESQMEENLRNKVIQNSKLISSKLDALVIGYDGRPIGVHVINPLEEGNYGIFHANLWVPRMRRQGVGMHSYPLACRIFMNRFNLKRILFKTPIQNVGAIRVKEKLGIRLIGEEIVGFGFIKDGTLAKVFELTQEEMKQTP